MHNRIKDIYALIAALALLFALLLSPESRADGFAAGNTAEQSNAWRFRVYLDDREIGYHDFYLAGNGEHRQLRSVARFEYKLLFVKLFHYEHENLETWSGNCLQSVRSQTDSNGLDLEVEGRRGADGFQVSGSAGTASLPECVMSFAYWNPVFLQQQRLLNTQDGSFLDITVSPPVQDELVRNGEPQSAVRYRLDAGEIQLDLWYSGASEWLGLESEVEGGRKLRYELI